MVRLRSKGLQNIPPCYHPQSTSMTLAIYYGGNFENGGYVGGGVRKLDYVDVEKLSFSVIDEYVQDLFVEGSSKQIYTAVKGGFGIISSEKLLKIYGRKYLKISREYPIFVQKSNTGTADRVIVGEGEGIVEKTDATKEREKVDEGVGIVEKTDATREREKVDEGVGIVEKTDATRERDKVDEGVGIVEKTDATEERDKVDEGVGNVQKSGVGEDTREAVNKGKTRESSVEFLCRAEDTPEWIAEYNARYGSPAEDEPIHDASDGSAEQVAENLSDQIVDDSLDEEDSEFDVDGNCISSDDDVVFEDYVNSSVEIGDENAEFNDESSVSLGDICEDVVVCDDGYLDLNRLSDEEGEADSFKPFNENTVYDPDFDIGQTFKNKSIFKKSVASYAIKIRRSLPCRRSDSRRVYVRCSEDKNGCPFKINAIKAVNTTAENKDAFVIRELCLEHTCEEGWDVKNVKTPWLAERFVALFKSDPKRSVMGFKEDVEDQLLVTVSRDQAYRTKQLATKMLQGDPDLQYTKLWDYANELRSTNPGSTIILGTEDIDGHKRFSKFYVCFEAMKQGFRSCRPIIGVDGCHLKGPHGGILLTAVGVDPDNSIFPLAYAIVSSETKDNWSWFFNVLRADLELGNGKDFTFISDKQKGLINALPEVFPVAEQRFCVRHMILNLNSTGQKGFALKNAIWKAANASTVPEFKAAMRAVREKFPQAADWLMDKHPSEWSRSHFLETSKCDQMLNNSCESFNSSILEARNKPIITMLEWIREYLMKKWHLSRETAEKWEGLVCPTIAKIVRESSKKVGGCRPIKASRIHFQVQTVDGQYAVDLGSRTCSCRLWQLTGIPCLHSLTVMNHEKLEALEFVDTFYHVSTYKNAYAAVIMPISGQNVWGNTLYIPPLPPSFGRKPGRPSKLRRRGIDESQNKGKAKKRGPIIRKLRRIQKTIHCAHCGEPGHNALFCASLPDSAKEKLERLKRKAFEAVGESSNFATTSSLRDEVPVDETHAEEADENEVMQDIHPPVTQVEDVNEQVSQTINTNIPPYSISDEPTAPGPSMFEQLQLGNNQSQTQGNRSILTVEGVQQAAKQDLANKNKRLRKTLGVRMRVPPAMEQEDQILTQQSVCNPLHSKKIVTKSGKKFLQLSGDKD